jgi:hypothetical protein
MMLDSTRTTRTLRYAYDMELAAADATTLIGTVAVLANEGGSGSASSRTWTSGGRLCRARKRRSVHDIDKQLGPLYFRRAHRMKFSTFKCLANELRQYILRAAGHRGGDTIRHVPNGRTSPDVRLACAIRWLSGGSPYDIMITTAIGMSSTLLTNIPDSLTSTPKITMRSMQLPKAFTKCQGPVSSAVQVQLMAGILIWIHKPSQKDCMDNNCDEGTFHCGRKKKYGLNCQAVCDVKRQILEISIL